MLNLDTILVNTGPLAKLLLGLIALAVTVAVARFALRIAWKLVLVAVVLVGGAYTLSAFSLI